MLLEPEFLASFEADVHLVADLMSLGATMPEKTKETARQVIRKGRRCTLMARLAQKTSEAMRGAVNKQKRTSRPRHCDIDWPRTIRANLQHYQAEHETIVPERLVGFSRKTRRADMEDVILLRRPVRIDGDIGRLFIDLRRRDGVDPCGLDEVRGLRHGGHRSHRKARRSRRCPVRRATGGGTDINRALAYARELVTRPSQTHLIMITDLYEGGNRDEMLSRADEAVQAGINVIVLLALSDDGRPFL